MTEEERKRLRELWDKFREDAPGEGSPVEYPPNRMAHLNPEIRRLLGEMSAEDAKTLREALQFYRNAHVVSKALRWIIITFALAIGGGVAFGDHIVNITKHLFGSKP